MSHSGALYDKLAFLSIREKSHEFQKQWGTKTQRIMMKFSVFVVGRGCAFVDFSKGHIQMLISALRDDNECNCKVSRRPAFGSGPPFLTIKR